MLRSFFWMPDVTSSSRMLGAGISVQAGIPDFRSPEGLFKTLKRDNPREGLASGRDLFDASVFNVSICYHTFRVVFGRNYI